MRRVGIVSVSVIVHAIVLAAIVRVFVIREVPQRELDGEPAPIAANAEPIEIAIVEPTAANEERVVANGPAATTARITTARGAASGTPGAATGTGTEPPAGTPTDGAPGRSPGRSMSMRGPDFALGRNFVDRFLENSKPLEPPVAKSGRVHGTGGGTAVIDDRVTTVTIDRDGTAHFADKPDFTWEWDIHLPTPSRLKQMVAEMGRGVADWYADPYKLQRAGRVQDLPKHMTAVPGACDSFASACSIEQRQLEANDDPTGSVAHGNMSITDWLMRKTVGDPYASRKLKLLDSTRDERVAMGEQHKREDLARSAEFTQRNLEALWRSTQQIAARKDALFAMWDECSEGEGATGEAGQRARLLIIGWIRAKLPQSDTNAFTADEIARLDGMRSSTQHFAPYAD